MENLDFLLAVNNIKRSVIEHISTISHRLNKQETKCNEAIQWVDSWGLHARKAWFEPCLGVRSKNKGNHVIFSLPTIPKKHQLCSHMERAAKIMGSYIKMTAGNWGSKISLCKGSNGRLKQQFSWKQRYAELVTTGRGNLSLCGIETMLPTFVTPPDQGVLSREDYCTQ